MKKYSILLSREMRNMENDKELKRNGEKESLVEINDNNRRE